MTISNPYNLHYSQIITLRFIFGITTAWITACSHTYYCDFIRHLKPTDQTQMPIVDLQLQSSDKDYQNQISSHLHVKESEVRKKF